MIFLRGKLLFLRSFSAAQSRSLFFSLYFPNFFFSSSSAAENTSPFIVDYLLTSVGLSPERAIKLSKPLSHIKSPSKPDAVLQFLKESGFSDAHIKYIISKNCRVLTAKVDATLKPNLKSLRERSGFSESQVLRLVSKQPIFILYRYVQPRINFWRSLLGSKEKVLNALIRSSRLPTLSLDNNIKPKITFLRGCGISDDHIVYMINSNPNLIVLNIDSIKSLIKQAEDLGLACGSGSFCGTLVSLCQISRDTMVSKLELLMSFGWPEEEIPSVMAKAPFLLRTSEKKMKNNMEFLVKRAGCESSYVMTHPLLLMLSLERKLIPWHYVLQLLRSHGLLEGNMSLFTFMLVSEKRFMERYILSYREKLPELHEVYTATCAAFLASLGRQAALNLPGSPYKIDFQTNAYLSSGMKPSNSTVYSCGDSLLGCSCGDCPSSAACFDSTPTALLEKGSCKIAMGSLRVKCIDFFLAVMYIAATSALLLWGYLHRNVERPPLSGPKLSFSINAETELYPGYMHQNTTPHVQVKIIALAVSRVMVA